MFSQESLGVPDVHYAQDRYRLTLRDRDADFFQRYVQRDEGFGNLLHLEHGLTDSRRHIRDNARFFHTVLLETKESARIQLAGSFFSAATSFLVTRENGHLTAKRTIGTCRQCVYVLRPSLLEFHPE
jgi:hypothetical protein